MAAHTEEVKKLLYSIHFPFVLSATHSATLIRGCLFISFLCFLHDLPSAWSYYFEPNFSILNEER